MVIVSGLCALIRSLQLKSARFGTIIVVMALAATVCLLSGPAFGEVCAAQSGPGVAATTWSLPGNTCAWLSPQSLGYAGKTTARRNTPTGSGLAFRRPTSWAAPSERKPEEHNAKHPPAPARCRELGGMLILTVAASWLVTLMMRNGRRTVYYRNGLTARTSFSEEIELGFSGVRR
jgi:hypothetical protein